MHTAITLTKSESWLTECKQGYLEPDLCMWAISLTWASEIVALNIGVLYKHIVSSNYLADVHSEGRVGRCGIGICIQMSTQLQNGFKRLFGPNGYYSESLIPKGWGFVTCDLWDIIASVIVGGSEGGGGVVEMGKPRNVLKWLQTENMHSSEYPIGKWVKKVIRSGRMDYYSERLLFQKDGVLCSAICEIL